MNFWLKSLRGQLILLSLLIVNIPILVAGYVMKQNAEQSLLEEKRGKLAAIAYILDTRLGPDGFDGILLRNGAALLSREEKIKILNKELEGISDEIAASSPGLGAGMYSRELDAIITYGPASDFGYTVGRSIEETHPGRLVMTNNQFRVEFGSLVRGNIMNAMRPIVREEKVIGYIFINELTDDIQNQLADMDRGLLISITIGILISGLLVLRLTSDILKNVQVVIRGVRRLRFNLHQHITGVRGEMGEVASTINELAVALGDARTLSENIMESIADGIIAVDMNGKITAFNKAAERMTGYSVQEVIGEYYEDLFIQDVDFKSQLLKTLRTGETCIGGQTSYPILHGKIWISVSTSMLRDIDGIVLGAVLVFEDLTERKRLEEQVNRADRLATLGELMAGVAHEIRNPLTSITGFLQYFQNAGSDEERNTYLPLLLREADRMNRIIETLLYFSRPCPKTEALTDLAKVLQDTMILLQSQVKRCGIVFETMIAENLPQVYLDDEQFKQIFLNLLINSLQAIEKNGIIRVKAGYQAETDTIEIAFIDSGPGIPEAIRDKVFDPFFTTKQTGTGLGLAVVQRIVAARGGQIDIEDNPDGGAVIRITIPRIYHQGEKCYVNEKNIDS
ncbi:MAG: signal transduction histidine kinase, nitrogen specific, NtrB [Firmicutes bacterium]|nr:signal transduction histidine kinase, nitrogen specific, NtrB [Bacillota bacterium]